MYENEVSRRPFGEYGPPKGRNVVTTTKVPLKAYYSSSSSPAADSGRVQIVRPRDKGVPQAQFYFYEEQVAPPKTQYQPIYVGREQSPGIQYVPRLKQAQYYYLPTTEPPIPYNRPKNPNTFKAHVTRLQQQIGTYKSSSPKPVSKLYPYNIITKIKFITLQLDNKFWSVVTVSIVFTPLSVLIFMTVLLVIYYLWN